MLERYGKFLVAAGAVLLVLGGVLWLVAHFGWQRLPGDIVLRGRNVTVYLPIGLCILLSIVATIVLNLIFRRR